MYCQDYRTKLRRVKSLNKCIKFVSALRAFTGRPWQGAAYASVIRTKVSRPLFLSHPVDVRYWPILLKK